MVLFQKYIHLDIVRYINEFVKYEILIVQFLFGLAIKNCVNLNMDIFLIGILTI